MMPKFSKEDEAKVRALVPILNEAIENSPEIQEAYEIIRHRGFEVRISSFNLEIIGKYIVEESGEKKDPTPIEITSMDEKFLKALHISSDDIPEI